MTDLLTTLDRMASPRLLVVGDLILDRYTWGDVERISPEAPVLVLRVDQEEVRLGGAASVAGLLRALNAEVTLAGAIGDDGNGRVLNRLLDEVGIDHSHVLVDSGRPTTTKERFMGRATHRCPQQILRVDREQREELPTGLERQLVYLLLEQLPTFQAILISDYAKGTCTPRLLAEIIAAANHHRVPLLVDPARIVSYDRYQCATMLTPNRLEAEWATDIKIHGPADAILAGDQLCRRFQAEAVIVKLDSDGIVLTEARHPGRHFPTRARQVHDVTGAGDMVLAIAGLCRACDVPWEETVSLANVAAGLEVERLGVAPISRAEIRAELGPVAVKKCGREQAVGRLLTFADLMPALEVHRRQGDRIVFTNGCFDLLHCGHAACLKEAARLGNILIVAMNSDASVRRLKGPDRPVVPEAARAALLAALGCVDYVLISDDDTPNELIRCLRPDVLAKGGTYSLDEVVGRQIVESYGGQVCVTTPVPGVSTTLIMNNLMARREIEIKQAPLAR